MKLWIKKWLRRICAACLNRLDSGVSVSAGSGDEPKAGRAYRVPSEEADDPLRQAFANLFAPRERMDEEVHFRKVGPDGILVARAEEWQRKGNRLCGRTAVVVVATCSGELVPPASLKLVCSACQGYDSVFNRCAVCSRTLCALCARQFTMPDGRAVVLCAEHRTEAERTFDTWAARDHALERARKASA